MKVAIVGAGKIGAALTRFFCNDDEVSAVILCDRNGQSLNEIEQSLNSSKLRTHRVGIEKEWSISTLVRGFDFLVSALPPEYNVKLTKLALEVGINYIDLGSTDETLKEQLSYNELAKERNVCIVPNSGFAPGLVNILALHGFEAFDEVESIKVRAAGLPLEPKPPLNFHLSFSPSALINEYSHDALILENKKIKRVKALDGYEKISFDTVTDLTDLEAFYTSGQITSLVRMLEGKVDSLDFKTIRYSGHRDIIKSLFMMGFADDKIIHVKINLTYRDLLIRQLSKNLPEKDNDIALIKIVVNGKREGTSYQRRYEMGCRYDKEMNMSALMKCAALPTLLTSKLIFQGKHKNSCGVFPPEKVVPKTDFIDMMRQKDFEISIEEHELTD